MKNLKSILGVVAVAAFFFVLPIAAETISGTSTSSAVVNVNPGPITVTSNNEADVIVTHPTVPLTTALYANLTSTGLDSSFGNAFWDHTDGDTLKLSGGAGGVLASGGFRIGTAGTAISDSIRGTITTDVASVAANACNADIAVTVSGAVAGAECIVGMPSTTPTLLQGTCFVSAANTAQLRICNGTNVASADPASAVYSVRVFNP